MGDDKGKQPEDNTWVRKALAKEAEFDLERACEMFMEGKKNFTKASTSGSRDKPDQEIDPSMPTTFLETCIKLLHDSGVVKRLQELINRCVKKNPGEPHVVQKICKNKARMGHEMRLTAWIGEYEMDEVILDLGLDTNVLPK